MTLSISQLLALAAAAGFSGDDLVNAVSVALAESGGNPNARGDTAITPGGSVGLWQINLKYHPEFNGQNLFDPATNAAAAYSVYQGAGATFQPWSTFKNGAFQRYTAAVAADIAPPTDVVASNGTDPNAPPDTSGSSGGGTLAMFAIGGLALWAVSQYLSG